MWTSCGCGGCEDYNFGTEEEPDWQVIHCEVCCPDKISDRTGE